MQSINIEHPEYKRLKSMWSRYRHLYAGGDELKRHADHYLLRRHKEPLDVYAERLDRVFYENYIGSIIDWYAATLFRREPAIAFEGAGNSGKEFFSRFCDDCNQRGDSLSLFMRQMVTDAMVYGRSYALVDFPRVRERPRNRAHEDQIGASRAYLVRYTRDQVINWAVNDEGELEWAVLRTLVEKQRDPEKDEWVEETRWVRFDRETFRVYKSESQGGQAKTIKLVDQGRHGLASIGRVPLFELRVSEGLWLMNKAALVQVEHFNKSNALAWALTMGLFASPVIYSDREFDQIVGESYYIQLGPSDRFGWTEPSGSVFEIAAVNLGRLKDEIYRVCYLINQASSPVARASQSGLSKQRDYIVTQEVLRAYGDVVKDFLKSLLRAIESVRNDRLQVDVSGLDEFDIGDLGAEIEDAANLLELGIESPTLRGQVYKRLAFKYLCDARPDIKAAVGGEIDEQIRKERSN